MPKNYKILFVLNQQSEELRSHLLNHGLISDDVNVPSLSLQKVVERSHNIAIYEIKVQKDLGNSQFVSKNNLQRADANINPINNDNDQLLSESGQDDELDESFELLHIGDCLLKSKNPIDSEENAIDAIDNQEEDEGSNGTKIKDFIIKRISDIIEKRGGVSYSNDKNQACSNEIEETYCDELCMLPQIIIGIFENTVGFHSQTEQKDHITSMNHETSDTEQKNFNNCISAQSTIWVLDNETQRISFWLNKDLLREQKGERLHPQTLLSEKDQRLFDKLFRFTRNFSQFQDYSHGVSLPKFNLCDELHLDSRIQTKDQMSLHNLELANYFAQLLRRLHYIDPLQINQRFNNVTFPAQYVNESIITEHHLVKQEDQILLVLKRGITYGQLDELYAQIQSHCQAKMIEVITKFRKNEEMNFEEILNGLQFDPYSQISMERGFNIHPCLRKLGEPFAEYEYIFENQIFLISTFQIQRKIEELKKVSFSDRKLLPDSEILRAQFVVFCLAASYYYHDKPRIDYSKLPYQLRIPMEELNQRRDALYMGLFPGIVGRSCIEAQIGNWKFNQNFQNDHYQQSDITLQNIEQMYTHLGMQDETIVSLVSGPLTCANIAPIFQIFNKIEKADNDEELLDIIEELNQIVLACIKTFNLIQAKIGSSNLVDQVLFIKTQPTLARSTYPGELNQTAGDHPVFRIFDGIVSRTQWNSTVGQQMKERDSKLPVAYQIIIQKMAQISEKLLDKVVNSKSSLLKEKYKELSLNYAGPHGYLEQHRRKIHSYIMMGFISGRTQTNGHFDASSRNDPENELSKEMWLAVKERLLTNPLFQDYEWPKQSLQIQESEIGIVYSHDVAFHNSQEKSLFIIQNNVYDLTKYLKFHPGGHKVLMVYAGTDITRTLEQVHQFDLNKISQLLGKYEIGVLKMKSQTHQYQQVCQLIRMLTLQQNYIRSMWIFDEAHIFDNKRNIPYHYVSKLPTMIYSENGYLVQFLSATSQTAHTQYLNAKIKSIFGQELDKEIRICQIGEYLTEIAMNQLENAQNMEQTLVKNMKIYPQMKELIDLYLDFTQMLKLELFKKAEIDQCNEDFTQYIENMIQTFLIQIQVRI